MQANKQINIAQILCSWLLNLIKLVNYSGQTLNQIAQRQKFTLNLVLKSKILKNLSIQTDLLIINQMRDLCYIIICNSFDFYKKKYKSFTYYLILCFTTCITLFIEFPDQFYESKRREQRDNNYLKMQDQISLQKQNLQLTHDLLDQFTFNPTSSPSQHTLQYLSFFQQFSAQFYIQKIVDKINAKQVHYTQDQFQTQLQAKILRHDKNFNIVVFQITYSYFQIEVSIIRTQSKSFLHTQSLKSISCQDSSIYFLKQLNQNYVAKCFCLNQKKKSIESLAQVIREYSLLKIASVLGIAPPLCNNFGFDLFINEECIEFFYEECYNIKNCTQLIDKEQIQNLKLKLRTLHAFKIIHLDIKPDNILYCPKKNQLVFIDFGFSKAIEEEIGFKSQSTFAGTMSYCSPQMTALSGRSSSFIDLYYNDLYSLKRSIQDIENYKQNNYLDKVKPLSLRTNRIKNRDDIFHSSMNQVEYKSIMNKLMILRLKYQIFTRNQRILKEKQFQELILNNIPEVLQFIAKQSLTKISQKIYEFIVANSSYPHSYFHSFFNLQQAKQHQINQLGKNLNDNFKKFYHVFSVVENNMNNIPKVNIPICFIPKEKEPNKQLFDKNLAKKYDNKSTFTVLSDFCNLVDFLSCRTTLPQKIQLSQKFILHFQIKKQDFIVYSQYPSLQLCLRFTLQKTISMLYSSFQDLIPQIIINLAIIQAFQPKQLVERIRQILRIDCERLKHLKMLFRLRSLMFWNMLRIQSSIKYEDATIIVLAEIDDCLLNLAMKDRDKKVKFIVMLILLDQRRKLPDHQIQKIAEQIEYLDTGDSQFNNELKISFFIGRMQNHKQSIYFYQFERIIYEINQIDPQLIFHPKKINHFHIELFQLFQVSGENHIFSNIYDRFQKCFQGTDILKKYRLYYTYRPQVLKKMDTEARLESLQNQSSNKIMNPSYQSLHEYNQILIQMNQLKQEKIKQNMFTKVRRVFNHDFLQKIVFPSQQEHKLNQFYVSNLLIAKIYIQLYQPESAFIQSMLRHINKLQEYQSTLSCNDCRLKSGFLLLQIKWRISRHLKRYQNAIYYLIQHIKILTENKVIQNEDLKFIFFDVRKIIQFITQLKLYKLQELKSSKSIEFVCKTIKQYKLHIYGLSHTEGLSVFSFICWYTLVINSQLSQFFQLNNQILGLIYQYPDKNYVNKYQYYFQKFIKEYDSWWKYTATTVIEYLFTNIKNNMNCKPLICLFLALFMKFCHPKNDHSQHIKYYICKDIELIDVRARTITLNHFFTYFLLQKGTMSNKRQKKYKMRKFASYIQKNDLRFEEFQRKMSISKQINKQRCIFSKKMRNFIYKFHKKLTE